MFPAMNAHNPYAPSKASLKTGEPTTVSGGLSRDGDQLVVVHGAHFRDRCAKCNNPAAPPHKMRKLYWPPPAIYLLLLVYGIVYIIVALIVRKNVEIDPGLCGQHLQKRRLWIGIGWAGALFGWIVVVWGGRTFGLDPGLTALLAIGFFVVSAASGILNSRVLYAKRIDDRHARLKGAGEEFLASLPTHTA